MRDLFRISAARPVDVLRAWGRTGVGLTVAPGRWVGEYVSGAGRGGVGPALYAILVAVVTVVLARQFGADVLQALPADADEEVAREIARGNASVYLRRHLPVVVLAAAPVAAGVLRALHSWGSRSLVDYLALCLHVSAHAMLLRAAVVLLVDFTGAGAAFEFVVPAAYALWACTTFERSARVAAAVKACLAGFVYLVVVVVLSGAIVWWHTLYTLAGHDA